MDFSRLGHITEYVALSGRNIDVDQVEEDVWTQGGTFVAPTVARIHQLSSTHANDDGDPAAAGVRTVRVFGLDSDGAPYQGDFTMNGVGNVATPALTFVYKLEALTLGATGSAVGLITATADGDSTVSCAIAIGETTSLQTIYRIPAAHHALIVEAEAGISLATAANLFVTGRVYKMPTGGAWELVKELPVSTNGPLERCWKPRAPERLEALTTISIRAIGAQDNNNIISSLRLALYKGA